MAGEAQPGLEGIDLFAQFVAVERHAGFQAERVAGAEAAGHDAQRLALLDDGLPDGRGDVAAHAQLEAVFAGVAGAADDAALPLGGRMQELDPRAAVVAHPLQVDVHQRLQDSTLCGPWMANMAHSRLTSVKITSRPGTSARSRRQMGVDPIDDLLPVAGVDHDHIERLAVGVVVVAHQHVVEDAALRRWSPANSGFGPVPCRPRGG